MDPAKRERLQELFQQAADLPPAEQEAFVRAACGDDAELHEQLRELLEYDSRDEDALDRVVGDLLEDSPRRPLRIGGYEVLRELGEGGMGMVYEARQKNPDRRVALKLIRAGYMTPGLVRRFQKEASILGRLQHPGIATVYEAGLTEVEYEDGVAGQQPFFAMELIEGQELDAWAEGHSTEEKLELVAAVCDAVHHAHERGIIHRDLKPGNVLVDERGQPKVLDFGIARVVDADLASMSMQTDEGQLLGTLGFMSPEQVAGTHEAIDARSDVYSLGVIVYHTLTGRLPLDVRGMSVAGAVRVIQEEDPQRLGSLDSSLRGDVETIVEHALEKEPERRYRTAQALGEDIRRYLRHEPILARPVTTLYQLRKFARRNPALVGGVAATLLALTLGVIGTTWFGIAASRGRVLAEQASARAESEAAQAKAATEFLQKMLSDVDPDVAQGHDITLREVLDKAAEQIDTSPPGDDNVEALLRRTIGATYTKLGRYEEAKPQVEKAFALEQARVDQDEDGYVEALSELIAWHLEMNNLATADSLTQELLVRSRARYGETSLPVALAYEYLTGVYDRRKDFQEALEYSRKSLAIRKQLVPEDDELVGHSVFDVGWASVNLGDLDTGEKMYDEALRIVRRTGDEKTSILFQVLAAQANLQRLRGNMDRAMEWIDQALQLGQEIYGPSHPMLVMMTFSKAMFLSQKERYAEAEPLARRALAGIEGSMGRQSMAGSSILVLLAQCQMHLGQLEEAEANAREALDICNSLEGDHRQDAFTIRLRLTEILDARGKYGEAVELGEALYADFRRQYDAGDASCTKTAKLVAEGLRALGRGEEAQLWEAKITD